LLREPDLIFLKRVLLLHRITAAESVVVLELVLLLLEVVVIPMVAVLEALEALACPTVVDCIATVMAASGSGGGRPDLPSGVCHPDRIPLTHGWRFSQWGATGSPAMCLDGAPVSWHADGMGFGIALNHTLCQWLTTCSDATFLLVLSLVIALFH
jgi:hypothetical protein